MANARQFKLEIQDWIKTKVPSEAAKLQSRIVAEALTLIVQATPVGNHRTWKRNQERAQRGLPPLPRGYVGGHARKNWQVTIGSPARSPLPGTDAGGNGAIAAGIAMANRIKQPVLAWIANPLPYMERLENGWSRQAPRGMVAQAVAAMNTKYRRVR